MSADGSAYAVLGLEPGADAEAIERAYKRLIKHYHPDRVGGDARRAAEINRAYRELRIAGRVRPALDLEQWDEPGASGAQVRAAVLLLAVAGIVTLAAAPMMFLGSAPVIAPSVRPAQARDAGDAMDQAIAGDAVDRGIAEARRISATLDEIALADASRDCHRELRAHPTLAGLDRCAAFDDAVVQLQDRDPLRDRGPFSELAVTGRKMASATLLSNDYLAIDGRLDQIRLKVELALAPPPSSPDPPPN